MWKSLALIIFSILLASSGQVLMKKGMLQVGRITSQQFHSFLPTILSVVTNYFVLFGFFCFGISSIIWLVVLSRVQLSIAYPMVALAYVFVVFFSMIMFKESVSFTRWFGVVLICLGVIFIARS